MRLLQNNGAGPAIYNRRTLSRAASSYWLLAMLSRLHQSECARAPLLLVRRPCDWSCFSRALYVSAVCETAAVSAER